MTKVLSYYIQADPILVRLNIKLRNILHRGVISNLQSGVLVFWGLQTFHFWPEIWSKNSRGQDRPLISEPPT